MTRNLYLRYCVLTIVFTLFSHFSSAQLCNPTENWLNTGFIGPSARLMTEMNGKLYAMSFHTARQEYVLYQYDGGASWTEMSAFPVGGAQYCMATYQNQIYFGGSSPIFNGEGITRWDSASNQWLSVGGGLNIGSGIIHDLEVYKNELYAAGSFETIGGVTVKGLAKWNGTAWDTVGHQSLLIPSASSSKVYLYSLETWNGKLVVGGGFTIPGIGAEHVAMWDGTTWTGFPANPDREVEEMEVFNGGLAIYGPYIKNIGTQPFKQAALWDNTAWTSMGMDSTDFVDLNDLITFKGELFAVGPGTANGYTIGGGLAFDGVAKWDGTQWHLITGFRGHGEQLINYQNRLYMSGTMIESCNMPMDHVVKLCTILECQPVSGSVYQDDNNNCAPDAGEAPLFQKWVTAQPGNYHIPTDNMGQFSYLIDTGSYTVNLPTLPTYYTSLCPAAGYPVTLTAGGGASGLDFGLVPIANVTDLKITATAIRFRPGFTSRIYVNFGNVGTVTSAGTIDLTLDPKLTAGIASTPIASQTGNTITWNAGPLAPSQVDGFWIEAALDTSTQIGDTLCLFASINPLANDTTPGDNFDTLKIVVTGSYDPNDKQVEPAGEGPAGDISIDTKILTYTIRFQNTGTDTAFTVSIVDEIDTDLDLGSLEIMGASHNYRFEVENGREVKWTFDNILLADSNTNESASHGFVRYTLRLNDNLPEGTKIENEAYIYFDFNAPIITNKTLNTLVKPTVSLDPTTYMQDFKVYPQPARDWVNIFSKIPVINGEVQLFDLQGRQVGKATDLQGNELRIDTQYLLPGVYFFRIHEGSRVLGSGKMVIR